MIDEHLKPQGTIDPDRGKKGADRKRWGLSSQAGSR
jgi:hypothetical protein